MRRLPSHILFQRIDAGMCATGHVGPTRREAGRRRSVQRVAFEDRVLQLCEETPSTCMLHSPIVGLAGVERYRGHLDHRT